MRDLARDLGHSIVFPVRCRHCGRPIYLFAAPDGGFAIFNSLGVPWPKHVCTGIASRDIDYIVPSFQRSGKYRFPIPATAGAISVTRGRVAGVVVGGGSSDGMSRGCNYSIYDGESVYNVRSTQRLAVGTYVERDAVDQSWKSIDLDPANRELIATQATVPLTGGGAGLAKASLRTQASQCQTGKLEVPEVPPIQDKLGEAKEDFSCWAGKGIGLMVLAALLGSISVPFWPLLFLVGAVMLLVSPFRFFWKLMQ